jgi:glycosyltransferase involved in cell wall biosynthesis
MRPAVSVVVPVRDGAATIGRTLAALCAQRLEQPFEVIVVDGGSTDATLEILKGAGEAITVLANPRGDPASARTLGAQRATADALAFTDADCQPEEDWLAAGLRALESAALVQGRVVAARPPGAFERTVEVGSEYGLYETANLFVRREAFASAGGFEPLPGLALPPGAHFGEDVWFAWRCKRAGWPSAFAADAVVRHAVFPRGGIAYVGERRRAAHFPPLVALVPELRERFLYRRWFLSPDSARFDLAIAGMLIAARGRRWGTLLAAPYAASLLRHPRGASAPERAKVVAARVAADAVTSASLAAGSARARTLVL